ncbi:DUF397 domain-containing protein [Streptomyces antimicrobicus]|uniref:DUF397 domain-containing protein n=1 Tax=Streptomyces antimicrobicus TaxID=2883108 RepID=A0ABS8B015_9ACTN|nr:DUF397 domain-containing protein [Streptomyces antimicrobicus]MCB5177942.1 DUF397 domain-containing protein [Streptomyces antimicrobicus]
MAADTPDIYRRTDLSRAVWHKSSRSNAGEMCLEVAFLDEGTVALRDSKDHSRPALLFSQGEWAAFTAGVRDGEFDR